MTAGRSVDPALAADELPDPDRIRVQRDPSGDWAALARSGSGVLLSRDDGALVVDVLAPGGVARVALRWDRPVGEDVRILGDAWERSYGELHWGGHRPERVLPWSFLVHEPATGLTWGAGVEVRGGAFASWTVDPLGCTLWLDLRSGDAPVRAGERAVHAARVRAIRVSSTPFEAQCALTSLLCRDPLLPSGPLVGANNWYYAYGVGFDAAAVLRDAATIVELADGHPVQPFGVVDDGWSADGTGSGRGASGGPWDRVNSPAFGAMSDLAAGIRDLGARPGIWYRPLLVGGGDRVAGATPEPVTRVLDPSDPATLEQVAADVARFAEWGYDLLKHDFSTWDALGRWGPSMGASVTGGGWAAADRSRTNAEVLVALYRTIRDAAGSMVLLGCNVVGHLAAGLTHSVRIGDDTSGRDWERTRRIGVNALAFRMAQHGRFFHADPDCVPNTAATDWCKNRQFLDVVARSGTSLFLSLDPAMRSDRVDADVAAAMRLALDGGEPGGVEPQDWMTTTTPERWSTASGERSYSWIGPFGADPFEAG